MKSRIQHVLREINGRNFKLFINTVKTQGLRTTFAKTKNAFFKPVPEPVTEAMKFIESYSSEEMVKGKYTYPESEEPLVSIIIPVYDHFKMTYDCVHALIDSDLCVPTEVIIADDCSPNDDYSTFPEYIPGVKICKTPQNYGFTLNCNNAAKEARGKYIFFLNNDTIVTRDWLKPLVNLAESDENIGLVGSKLLFMNGSLQEAGGILWKDGSAWNYGRDQDASLPEFCYVHDTDYVSGAAILVRRDLFESLEGFDKRYAPAYCEDSDLAFEIRRLGYRTVLHPFSIIYHFEGMSNGKRVDAGLKQYQVVNKEKFMEKWKDTLEEEHFPNAENVFQARDRSRFKTTILFVEEMVPKYDDNAGHRTVYDYLKTLAQMGYNVKYLPNNFFYDEKYTPVYQEMGIEVLYGKYYWDNWEKWIADNGKYFDHVMIYRPEIAERYLDHIRAQTKAKIHYNVADLHYLRLMREYEVTGNKSFLKESKTIKTAEYEYISKSDQTIVVSCDEAKIINDETHSDKAKVFPIFCFDDVEPVERDYVNSKDLVFVGGFSHRPNVDAMLWFIKDIFPTIVSEIPDVKLHVVGSGAPKELINLASDNVIIEGRVSDEKLDQFYKESAVCVIPLRYGAGVKGKTVESMHSGIPIVSTSIGLEGLEDISEYMTGFDDAKGFAQEVIRLYKDRSAAESESIRHFEYVADHFSRDSMKALFLKEFGPPLKK